MLSLVLDHCCLKALEAKKKCPFSPKCSKRPFQFQREKAFPIQVCWLEKPHKSIIPIWKFCNSVKVYYGQREKYGSYCIPTLSSYGALMLVLLFLYILQVNKRFFQTSLKFVPRGKMQFFFSEILSLSVQISQEMLHVV